MREFFLQTFYKARNKVKRKIVLRRIATRIFAKPMLPAVFSVCLSNDARETVKKKLSRRKWLSLKNCLTRTGTQKNWNASARKSCQTIKFLSADEKRMSKWKAVTRDYFILLSAQKELSREAWSNAYVELFFACCQWTRNCPMKKLSARKMLLLRNIALVIAAGSKEKLSADEVAVPK